MKGTLIKVLQAGGYQPGVYVPLKALILVYLKFYENCMLHDADFDD